MALEPQDVPDTIEDVTEGPNRTGVAIYIAVLAVILSITSMGGANATKEMLHANIQASDLYAFYQAKTVRQTSYRLAADELLALRASSLWLPGEAADLIDRRLASYQAIIDKYESEPATGEGRAELLVRAKAAEATRDHAGRQDPFFDYGEAMLQIAIVLASAAIVARRRWVLWLSVLFATAAVALTINAYALLVEWGA